MVTVQIADGDDPAYVGISALGFWGLGHLPRMIPRGGRDLPRHSPGPGRFLFCLAFPGAAGGDRNPRTYI